ncbi:hypothetical protein [Isobaculum melis]|uniref:ABC-2 type transport system permease protein n=1 Tax=Isobaculum melis TaxID=142588 RepID=A0A1H9U860_9LACT|nr:hypothetical protein [Isobaculum melis]SES05428.1 ABC-2 type transport system permease protein [Isobaculum melis]
MTGKLIFKMEMFKFKNDKKYLMTAGIIGVLNTILALMVINMDVMNYYDYGMLGTVIGFYFMLMLGNIIFMFFYPFHVLSMDYKNNVIATMIASGVNRTKLFVSKIGAIIVNTIMIGLITTFVPFVLLMLKATYEAGFGIFFEEILGFFQIVDIDFISLMLMGLTSYLGMIMMMTAASTILKGGNLSFLLFIGFSMATSIATGILSSITTAFDLYGTGLIVYNIFINLIIIAVFGYLGLSAIKKQNL